ncbi:hypothetical protein ACJJIL_21415 [Microbulbifer sp. EKSA005]|uniref:hypothetical protein n=1 Tax=Microbulbifer sp. EKSA005 TaxID=3243364 RepID=UPI0040418587
MNKDSRHIEGRNLNFQSTEFSEEIIEPSTRNFEIQESELKKIAQKTTQHARLRQPKKDTGW